MSLSVAIFRISKKKDLEWRIIKNCNESERNASQANSFEKNLNEWI